MTFLSQQDMRLRSSGQREALTELLTDIDNLRSAQEWALTHEEFALIETAMRAYSTLFDALGWAQEALDYLERVKKVLESRANLSQTEQVALAHVLTARSLFAFRVSQNELAHSMLERSLEILRPLHEPRILVEALTFLGIVKYITGDLASALELFREGFQLAMQIDDRWYAALCLTEEVGIYMWMGKLDDIHKKFQSAVDAWRQTGDRRFTAFGLNSLSLGAIAVGNYDEAYAALEESIAINTIVGDRWGLGSAQIGLGMAAQAQEKYEQALNSFREGRRIFTELGANWEVARILSEMGKCTFALGNSAEAERLWLNSLKLSQETQGMPTTLESIVGIANVRAERGNYKDALQLLLVSIPHFAIIPKTRAQAEKLALELQEKLSLKEIEAAQTFAGDNPIEDVVREVLGG